MSLNMLDEFFVVPMELKHLEGVADLEIRTFPIPWSKESFKKEIQENKMAYYFVAIEHEKEKIIGYAGMWHVVTEGHITNVAVDEDHRRKGIGQKLISALIEVATQKEMIGLTLEVRIGNRSAMSLYSKNGFMVEGYRKNYYSDTKEDAAVMWKVL